MIATTESRQSAEETRAISPDSTQVKERQAKPGNFSRAPELVDATIEFW